MRLPKGLFGYSFQKLFFILKNKENKENTKERVWFLIFYLFFVMKNIGNIEKTKFRDQEQFSENVKMMFFLCFQKLLRTVFKSRNQTDPQVPLMFKAHYYH